MADISNDEIKKFFHNETNDDYKENFVCVHSSNLITRFINYFRIIKEKDRQYPYLIQTDQINLECNDGAFLIFIQKQSCFYLTARDLKD